MTKEEFATIKIGDYVELADIKGMDVNDLNKAFEVCGTSVNGNFIALINNKGYLITPEKANLNGICSKYLNQRFFIYTISYIKSKVNSKAIKSQSLMSGSIYSNGKDGETLGPSGLHWL